LLVPGYGGATGSLQTLAVRLTAAGRDATVVPLPGAGTGDLGAAADALAVAAVKALARSGAESVDVVGYSAGGVIARLWIADGGAEVTRRVVTLGSPHHGTTLADLAGDLAPEQCPLGCTQLGTDSDLLARLNAGDETPDGPTWVSIWTTQDQTVTPPDSARLDGALNLTVQSVCAGARVGHGQLPRDPVVQGMVLAELQPGEPDALGPADCERFGG
jgi:triacylglycerol esterase/lipase EstA (alpha/beta hydrolase family)